MANIDRREFIRRSATLGAAAALGTAVPGFAAGRKKKEVPVEEAPKDIVEGVLKFRADGKFRMLQLTDTHHIKGDPRSKRALDNVNYLLDTEKPDFVIHTGDSFYGEPAEACIRDIFQPIVDRGIPFALVMGNHEADFSLKRPEVMEIVRSLPGCMNTVYQPYTGDCNEVISLRTPDGNERKWVFYLFDSHDYIADRSVSTYNWIHDDQISWYRRKSAEFTAADNGSPVPSMAFFHIPFPEYNYAIADKMRILKGNFGEEPCSPDLNSGLFTAMYEMKDVKSVFTGHDHDDDFIVKYKGMFLGYGRYSGGDTEYNNLKPNGGRMFEFEAGKDSYRTWIRLSDGTIPQDLIIPDSYKRY